MRPVEASSPHPFRQTYREHLGVETSASTTELSEAVVAVAFVVRSDSAFAAVFVAPAYPYATAAFDVVAAVVAEAEPAAFELVVHGSSPELPDSVHSAFQTCSYFACSQVSRFR